MEITGKKIIEYTGGRLLQAGDDFVVRGLAIDSREIKPGDLFIPLRGENTDGHLFIAAAAQKNAAAALFTLGTEKDAAISSSFPLVGVKDALLGLQQLATCYRDEFDLPMIAITGSSGKTTTKDFTAGVLATKYKTLKTTGNLNNEIGLPLTIAELTKEHQVAVLEMGMSAPGEITTLCEIAKPTIGVITNIGAAHLEQLGTLDAIEMAKEELLDYLGSGGVAVLNGDDPRLLNIGRRFPGKAFYYGFNQGDIKGFSLSQRGENCFFRVRFPDGEEGSFEAPLPGRESASNALAALTLGYILGLDKEQMRQGLLKSETSAGRLRVLYNRAGLGVIDDTYNANPDSVRAALKVLSSLGGRKTVAVLADMLELGAASGEAHTKIGRFAADCSIRYLVTLGKEAGLAASEALSLGLSAKSCSDHGEVLAALKTLPLEKGWFVLVKGSRGMKMEKIVQALLKE